MQEELYDVIIIGGGPAGLTAAQYAARSNLKTIVLDKSPDSGALAYTSKIENYPGFIEPVSGKDLLDIFRKHALKFGSEYVQIQVAGVKLDADIKEVYCVDRTFRSKTVIIATGSMGRKPTIPGEEKFLGKGVSYCATCDAAFFREQSVAVFGDSEEALKEAGFLTGFAQTIYLISPSKNIAIADDDHELKTEKLRILAGHRITSIEGDDVVTKITVKDMSTGNEKGIPVDGVFIYLYGTRPVVDFLQSSLPLSEEKSCILTHRMTETTTPGVFAAGDVTCTEVRQVVIASAFGCMAALSAEKFITNRKRVKFDWAKS